MMFYFCHYHREKLLYNIMGELLMSYLHSNIKVFYSQVK